MAEADLRLRAWLAVPLVALAGCVDAIGWLRLHELFVSFMSGTSTMLGVALAEGRPVRAAELAVVVGLFTAGAVVAAGLGRLAGRWRAPVVLGLVAALLGCGWRLPPVGGAGLAPLAFAVVPAMGALNLALPGVGGITFVTGALTRFAEALMAAVAGAGRHEAWVTQLAAWAALVAGATLGAALDARLGGDALAVPAAAALAAAGVAAAAARRTRG
ncbi:DUF1275 family protein [Paeniroseomonas aquatica]|uniref:DUF1275 family protein n=1 Tax=Paeniroseomonas aquatica TaxID=373043 RepID=UPI00361E5B09